MKVRVGDVMTAAEVGRVCVSVCLRARTRTRVEADGEHSPDSHVKKPLESRAGASFS